jgi:hypothetical protein
MRMWSLVTIPGLDPMLPFIQGQELEKIVKFSLEPYWLGFHKTLNFKEKNLP